MFMLEPIIMALVALFMTAIAVGIYLTTGRKIKVKLPAKYFEWKDNRNKD